MGIEPTFKAWEALVLPLNYTRSGLLGHQDLADPTFCLRSLNQQEAIFRFPQEHDFLAFSECSNYLGDPLSAAAVTFTLASLALKTAPGWKLLAWSDASAFCCPTSEVEARSDGSSRISRTMLL